MTSELQTAVVSEFCLRAPCGRTDIKSGSLETEAIQKFLSVCLKQYFSCSQDETNEASFSNVSPEILEPRSYAGSSTALNAEDQTSTSEDTGVELDQFSSADVSCRFCKDDMAPVSLALKNHLDACPLFPVQCPNMCGKMSVPREKLTDHIIVECPNTCDHCAYQDIGCSFQGTKTDLTKHLQESTENHLQMALEVIKEQRTELGIMRGRLRKQDENIAQLTESVSKLGAVCEEAIKHNHEQEKTINRLCEQMKEQKKHQSKYEKDLKSRIADLEQRGLETPPQNGLISNPGLGSGYGELVWRISNFSRRLQRVQSGRIDDPMTSEPFYTSAFGYKIVVWAYINGRGKEEGKCLSLYACVMSGEYDAILRWPIRPRYTFSLLDQNPDSESRKDLTRVRKVHDFKRDEVRRKGIERPGRDERAIIVGFDDFVKQEELEAGNFLADDTLFIRVLVDMSESYS